MIFPTVLLNIQVQCKQYHVNKSQDAKDEAPDRHPVPRRGVRLILLLDLLVTMGMVEMGEVNEMQR